MDVRSRLCLLFMLSVSVVMAQTELNPTEVPTEAPFITDVEMATEMMTENSTELGDSTTASMPPTDANIPALTCADHDCGVHGTCIGNETFIRCDCDNFSQLVNDYCQELSCETTDRCKGPGDVCYDHHGGYMCFCNETLNRFSNQDHSDCVENSSSTLKTSVTSIAMTTNQTTMAPGTTSTTKSTTDKTGPETPVTTDAKQITMAPGTTLNTKSATDKTETETPVTTDAKQITMAPGTTSTTKSTTDKTGPETPVATDANQIITAPGTSSTRKSPTDQMEAGTSVAPDATISPESTEGIRSTKTSMKAPTPKDQSSGAPTDKVKPSPNHSYTGAIVGLFIFLVATGVLFVAIYLVRRRKLRNNYGRLEEDTEGDGGWSAFSKNPIYRGDKDYQPL